MNNKLQKVTLYCASCQKNTSQTQFLSVTGFIYACSVCGYKYRNIKGAIRPKKIDRAPNDEPNTEPITYGSDLLRTQNVLFAAQSLYVLVALL